MALEAPAVGGALAAIFIVAACYFQWINPNALMHMGKVIALLLWLLAGIVAFAALVGFLGQKMSGWRRSRRLDSLRTIQDIHKLSSGAFEQTIADLFRRQGYRVDETGGTGDGGVDLILRRHNDPDVAHLVQCKRYRSWKVGIQEVREFYGAMAAHRTSCEGIFVTCGRYTSDARAFAADNPIRLIDGDELLRMLNSTNRVSPAVETFTDSQARAKTPVCPNCQIPLVRRTAQSGPFAGKPFWGCSNYPKCRTIVDA